MTGGVAIIRNRYQLTIPASLRKLVNWLTPQRAVKIVVLPERKVMVEPYKEKATLVTANPRHQKKSTRLKIRFL